MGRKDFERTVTSNWKGGPTALELWIVKVPAHLDRMSSWHCTSGRGAIDSSGSRHIESRKERQVSSTRRVAVT